MPSLSCLTALRAGRLASAVVFAAVACAAGAPSADACSPSPNQAPAYPRTPTTLSVSREDGRTIVTGGADADWVAAYAPEPPRQGGSCGTDTGVQDLRPGFFSLGVGEVRGTPVLRTGGGADDVTLVGDGIVESGDGGDLVHAGADAEVSTGAGDDLVLISGRTADGRVDCGPGADVLFVEPNTASPVSVDCERIGAELLPTPDPRFTGLAEYAPGGTAPTVRVLGPRGGTIGSDAAGAECAVDGGEWAPCSDAPLTVAPEGPDRLRVAQIRVRDGVGRIGVPRQVRIQQDTTPPATPVLTAQPPPNVELGRFTSFALPNAGEPLLLREWAFHPVGETPVWSPPLSIRAVETGLSPSRVGPHVLSVRSVDPGGNVSPAAEVPVFVVAPASSLRVRLAPTLSVTRGIARVTCARPPCTVKVRRDGTLLAESRGRRRGSVAVRFGPRTRRRLARGPLRAVVEVTDGRGRRTLRTVVLR